MKISKMITGTFVWLALSVSVACAQDTAGEPGRGSRGPNLFVANSYFVA